MRRVLLLFLSILQVTIWWSKVQKHRHEHKLRQIAPLSLVTARLRRNLRGLSPLWRHTEPGTRLGTAVKWAAPPGEAGAAACGGCTAKQQERDPGRHTGTAVLLAWKKREEIYRGIMETAERRFPSKCYLWGRRRSNEKYTANKNI